MFNIESRHLLNLSVQNALDCISENFNLKFFLKSMRPKLARKVRSQSILVPRTPGGGLPYETGEDARRLA